MLLYLLLNTASWQDIIIANRGERASATLTSVSVAGEILRSTAGLRALTPSWTQLWHADTRTTPFQHPAWLLPWWNHFAQPDLRVAVLKDGDELLAMMPLYIYSDPVSRERQLLLIGAGTSDYLDGIFSPRCTPEHLLPALDALLEDPSWDVAHLSQLRPDSPLFKALGLLKGARVTPDPGEICSRCPASTVAALPTKVRADVRYYRNFAIGRGPLELAVADETLLQSTFDLLVRFHTDRWEVAGEPGVLADPAVLAWHREALPLLRASGLLRLCELRLDAETIAALYSLVDPPSRPERVEYFYLMGFNTAAAELRPGRLLTALSIERAAQEGVHTIDMLRGKETYKQFWHVKPVST